MKIKVTSKEKEIEGTFGEGEVKPFGNAGHIVMSKKHNGKIVNVVIPKEPEYFWLLSEKDLNETLLILEKIINKKPEKFRNMYMENLKELKKKRFSYEVLMNIYELLKTDNSYLAKKIKQYYSLNL